MGSQPAEKTEKCKALPRSPELMNREDSALLVIDMQEKLLAVVPNRARLVWNARRLLDAAAALGVPVAGTEQYPERLSPTVPRSRTGSVLLPINSVSAQECAARSSSAGRTMVDIVSY